ncbi:hypothetical protein BDA96_03G145900 [Sorghum bicolor]|uniref:Uncharacterized protein n=1 Tax=Sorghum bicolor TaxID=4558 RepID=A0A921RCV5_SORBI|nr:hypothetical protein BDA96_03G145900 [Sorghum bicolor]KAG0537410.1 hypothetical protein BDA96_03G145900 [Sorghum bicolor]
MSTLLGTSTIPSPTPSTALAAHGREGDRERERDPAATLRAVLLLQVKVLSGLPENWAPVTARGWRPPALRSRGHNSQPSRAGDEGRMINKFA